MQLLRPIVIDRSSRRAQFPDPLSERAIVLRNLRSDDADDRGAAICAVVRLLNERKNVRAYLVDVIKRLGDNDEAVCLAAIDALGDIAVHSRTQSRRALFLIRRLARGSNEALIKNAAFTVGWIAEQGVNISFLDVWLMKFAANPDQEVADAGKWALAKCQIQQRFVQ